MGVFTAVGGGMLRDGFMGDVPGIFQRTKLLRHCLHRRRSNLCGAHESYPHIQRGRTRRLRFVTIALRWLSIRFDIKSPTEDDFARWFRRKK